VQRLTRILVYEGSPIWIQDCLHRRRVKGSYHLDGENCIKEAIVGDFLEEVKERRNIPVEEHNE
jgi:hypothetical protein